MNIYSDWSRPVTTLLRACWKSSVFYKCTAQSFNRATQGRPLRELTKLPRSDGACLRRYFLLHKVFQHSPWLGIHAWVKQEPYAFDFTLLCQVLRCEAGCNLTQDYRVSCRVTIRFADQDPTELEKGQMRTGIAGVIPDLRECWKTLVMLCWVLDTPKACVWPNT